MFRGTRLPGARLRGVLLQRGLVFLVALALLAPLARSGAAATPPAPTPAATAHVPPDELDRGTPQGTVAGFLNATLRRDYARAARYLDLRGLPPSQAASAGPVLARKLRVVLDHTPIDVETVPAEPEGRPEPGMSPGRQIVGRVVVEGRTLSIALERMRRDDGVLIWMFSGATLARVPEVYSHLTYGFIAEQLPPALAEVRVLGLALWQWIGVLLLVGLGLLLGIALVRPGMPGTRWLLARLKVPVDAPSFGRSVGPARLLIALIVFRAGQAALALPVTANAIATTAEKLALVAVMAWLAARLVEVTCEAARRRLVLHQETASLSLVDFAQRAIKIAIGTVALLLLLQAMGVQVSALVAAVGVGGIGLALAAQRIVENLFAGLAIIGDQPVRVGDACRFGAVVGTVERIGLWSTRIRTPERSVVSIPNASFMTMQIDNLQQRDRILFTTVLRLRYETTADQLRWVMIRARELLYAHPRVDPDPARVRLVGFGASGLEVEVFAYVRTTSWEEFVAVREELGLKIMDLVATAGTAFALPAQASYEGGEGFDRDKAAAAAAEVERWRGAGELPLPEFPPERVRALRTAAIRAAADGGPR